LVKRGVEDLKISRIPEAMPEDAVFENRGRAPVLRMSPPEGPG